MLTKFKEFVKIRLKDLLLLATVIMISLLSFAVGYLTASYQEKEAIKIETQQDYQP